MSKKYKLDATDATKIFKVVMYAGASGVLVSLIGILPQIDVPMKWIWLLPIVNISLVAIKKVFSTQIDE